MHVTNPVIRSSGLIALFLVGLLAGCSKESPRTVSGFVLPEGDVTRGQAVFIEQGCHQCHSIAKLDLPAWDGDATSALDIEIGGKRARIKEYGDLLTSVVNPQHVLSKEYERLLAKQNKSAEDSPMPDFNSRMTVSNLIDLVQFLHSRYEELVPDYRGYRYTYGP